MSNYDRWKTTSREEAEEADLQDLQHREKIRREKERQVKEFGVTTLPSGKKVYEEDFLYDPLRGDY